MKKHTEPRKSEWGMTWYKERITALMLAYLLDMAHSSSQFEGIYQEHIHLVICGNHLVG